MLEIGLGLAAFGLLCLYDFIKMWRPRFPISFLFFVAALLLVFATTRLVDFRRILASPGAAVLFAVSLVFFGGMIYALFFALPFRQAYGQAAESPVVTTGLYALCRHPGVLFFIGGYLFLWLSAGGTWLLIAAVTFSLADVAHVFFQDRVCFPKTLAGYDRYQRETPFFWPNRRSFGSFFTKLT